MYSAIYRLILSVALVFSCFLAGNAQTKPAKPQSISPRSEAGSVNRTVDLLPKGVGDFKAAGTANPVKPESVPDLPQATINQFGELSAGSRSYLSLIHI